MNRILIAIFVILASAGIVYADIENLGDYDKTTATISAGHYWGRAEDNRSRAGEYISEGDSGSGSLVVKGGNEQVHFIFDGDYKNENDFAFNMHFDSNNAVRLDLRLEKLIHNLDHLVYDPANPEGRVTAVTSTTGPLTKATFSDSNIGDEYYLKGLTSEAKARVKLPDMPSHFNISYWQYQKEGEEQFRFVDEGCGASACHFQSRTREFDRTIHEVSGAFDAHLGAVDLILKHTYREFRTDDPIPVDSFQNHFRFRPGAGDFQHDADPESHMYETTLEAHSSFAGGLNLAGSATYGVRKNDTEVTGASPIQAEIDYVKVAADITHTTSSRFSYNFKTRYLNLENENSSQIDPFIFDGLGGLDGDPTLLSVRPSIDLDRAEYELNTSYRVSKKLNLKGNLRAEHIKRTETGLASPFHSSPFTNDLVWELPEEEVIVSAKVSFFARPFASPRSRLNGWYKYKVTNDPAYGTSSSDSHQVFLSTSYAESKSWGVNASVSALYETNDEYQRTYIDESVSPAPYLLISDVLERTKQQQNVNLGLWFTPVEDFYSAFNYGYNRIDIEQDITFGMDPADSPTAPFDYLAPPSTAGSYIITDRDVPYLQEVHNFNYHLSRQFTQKLKAMLDFSYTRSLGYYDPDFATNTFQYNFGTGSGDASSDDLKEISRYDIDQYGFKAGIDYYFTPNFEMTLEYAYDDYREKYTDALDGTVHTGMANLAYQF